MVLRASEPSRSAISSYAGPKSLRKSFAKNLPRCLAADAVIVFTDILPPQSADDSISTSGFKPPVGARATWRSVWRRACGFYRRRAMVNRDSPLVEAILPTHARPEAPVSAVDRYSRNEKSDLKVAFYFWKRRALRNTTQVSPPFHRMRRVRRCRNSSSDASRCAWRRCTKIFAALEM